MERFVSIKLKINDSRLCRKLLPGYGNKTNVPCLPNALSARLKFKTNYLKNVLVFAKKNVILENNRLNLKVNFEGL